MKHTRRSHHLLGALAVTGGLMASMVPATAGAAPASSTPSSPGTVWLCNPNQTPDPCTGNLNYAVVPPVGPTTVNPVKVASKPPVDCFYVYPTISAEPGPNADLTIQPNETFIAQMQAAPFSQVCRVFAPMYRQVTTAALTGATGAKTYNEVLDTAYASMASGFRTFLALEPKNRHFVLIGHSQGAAMLIRLIKNQIDPNPALRSRLVSALLLGGNLTVAKGKKVGGAFAHIPLCSSGHQLGCAIAYSSFYSQPPASSFFGIPGQGVSLMWGQTSTSKKLEVACVNPASFGSGSARLDARFSGATDPGAAYVAYPALYRSSCQYSKGTSFLHVTVEPASASPAAAHPNERPIAVSTVPNWGLHDWDVNLGMGSLVAIVAREESSLKTHHYGFSRRASQPSSLRSRTSSALTPADNSAPL